MENNYSSEKAGILDYLSDLFFEPSSLADRIDRKPRILIPMILCCVLTLATSLIQMDLAIEYSVGAAAQNLAAMGQTFDATQLATQIRSFYPITAAASSLLIVLVTALEAGILVGLSKLFKGGGGFKKVFSLLLFAFIIASLGGVITALLKVFTGNFVFDLSPATFLFDKNTFTFPWYYSWIIMLNPFNIWFWFVVWVGIQRILELSRKNAAIVIGILVLLSGTLSSLMSSFAS